jgi:hypothetical protein
MSTPESIPNNQARSQGKRYTPLPPPAFAEREPEAPAEPSEEQDGSRVLFEELDALLERMLALPVSYAEEAEEVARREHEGEEPLPEVPLITIAEAGLEADPGTMPLTPTSLTNDTLYEQSEPDALPDNPPAPVPRLPSFEAPPSFPLQPEQTPLSKPAPIPEGRTEDHLPLPSLPRAPLWARPLVWCNTTFDTYLMRLGTPGRWLGGPGGKTLLGWTGLLCLLTAGGLFLCDWFGWTW